ncbi:MAG: alginate export family protein [Pseudomonadota bacterium]
MRLRFISLAAVVLLPYSAAQAQTAHQYEPSGSGSAPKIVLSGQLRERLTYLDNFNFDPDHPDNGWFLAQRAAVTADAEITPELRARVTLQSGLLEGPAFEPIQRNDLDIQEAYLEFGPKNAFVRVGRQEVGLGSYRLVSNRDGTNLKRTWDGIRGIAQLGDFELQAMALSEVVVQPEGAFNDPVAEGDTLAGVYLTGPAPLGKFDAYFLYSGFDARRTIEGTAEQDRYTIGARWFGDNGRVFWNAEGFYQFGNHGDLDISAWSVAANVGLRLEGAPWKPEIMLSANIASGDSENGDGKLGTFDALFPRGNYFSQAAILGPSNFTNINPSIRAFPDPDLELFANVNFHWRLEEEDGVYGPPFILFREPGDSDARFVNTSVTAGAKWQVTPNLQFAVIGTYSAPGRFIEETGPAENISYLEFTTNVTF